MKRVQIALTPGYQQANNAHSKAPLITPIGRLESGKRNLIRTGSNTHHRKSVREASKWRHDHTSPRRR
jgi:hypothetical protein